MPELPEVETIRRDLQPNVVGQRAVQVVVRDRRLMTPAAEARFKRAVLGQLWKAVIRKGKYLIAELDSGWEIIFHLRMTGQLVLGTAQGVQALGILDQPSTNSKDRLSIVFDNGMSLLFHDQRRFGEVFLRAPQGPWPGKTELGPDPLDELSQSDFIDRVRRKTTRIKPLLMDQSFLAGVGNIYAQEALFKASIRPNRPANRISRQEANSLYTALKETLLSAIEHRGSTARNYRDAFGRAGSAQDLHTVYDRGGEPCLRCRTVLRASRVGGRGTVYCPRCQK